MILDLGCGRQKIPGSVGVDVARIKGVDVVSSIECLPFGDNSADVIYLSHVLEHVDALVPTLEEIWRVSKHGAVIHVWAPHFSCGLYTWADPTHRRSFTTTVFDYFQPSAALSYYSRARFQILQRELHFGLHQSMGAVPGLSPTMQHIKMMIGFIVEPIANFGRMSQLLCERLWGPWIGFEEVYFRLSAVKDGE